MDRFINEQNNLVIKQHIDAPILLNNMVFLMFLMSPSLALYTLDILTHNIAIKRQKDILIKRYFFHKNSVVTF